MRGAEGRGRGRGLWICLELLMLLWLPRSLLGQTHPHPQQSEGFEYEGFVCPPAACPLGVTMLHSAYVHMVVGTDHASALPLLVHRVCGLVQQCVDKTRMRIVLHSTSGSTSQDAKAQRFLRSLSAPFTTWNGTFSADSKMTKSFDTLRGIHAHDTLVLQMDVDEEPEAAKFNQALRELEAQHCDAVFAYWQDRLALEGNLSHVALSAPLSEQFPLRCDLSGQVVRGGKTTKTIAYRADARLDGGQHDVWCDRSGSGSGSGSGGGGGGSGRAWNRTRACAEHAHDRAKSRLLPLILAHTPNLRARPRYCPTKVPLRHFKFVRGVEEHLSRRAASYKRQGLHWWKDSKLFVEHLRAHGGRVCVHCPGMRCVDTRTGAPLAEDALQHF